METTSEGSNQQKNKGGRPKKIIKKNRFIALCNTFSDHACEYSGEEDCI